MLDEFDEERLRGTKEWSLPQMAGVLVLALASFVYLIAA